MSHETHVLLTLFIMYVAAQIGAEISQRLKLPSVVGEITAGVVIGPYAYGLIKIEEEVRILSELGVIFLLFSVGLETKLSDLKRVGVTALFVGLGGVILPLLGGTIWAELKGFGLSQSLFIACAFIATSAGITARVLQEMNLLSRIESQIILGAAVIDDVLAMMCLAVVTGLNAGEGFSSWSLGVVLLQAIIFIGGAIFLGSRVMPKTSNIMDKPMSQLSPLTLSLALCLGLAVLASYIGLAAIIGAFLAGVLLSETEHREHLEHQLKPIAAFFVPFFFVATGAQVALSQLANFTALVTLGIVVVIAVITKYIGCMLGSLKLGFRSASIIGVGMVPRGEVGLIIASLGKQANIFNEEIYAYIVGMSLLTSVIAPPILKQLFVIEKIK